MKLWPFLLLLSLMPWSGWADEATRERLEQVQAEQAEREKKAAALKREAAAVLREMRQLQRQLIEITEQNQRTAAEVERLQGETGRLDAEIATRRSELITQQGELAETLALMQRFARTPPAVLLMGEREPRDMVLADRQLQALMPALNERLKKLTTTVNDLRMLADQLVAEKAALAARQEQLVAESSKLERLVAQRQEQQKKLARQSEAEREAANKLAREARNLQDLMAQLERKPEVFLDPEEPEAVARALPDNMATRLPAAGQALIRFGEKNKAGVASRGITIRTRENAPVVAPARGNIAFAGPFRGYGRVIIIEHPGGWHSVVAGLTDVQIEVGQKVAGGEPLGTMGETTAGRELYFELRRAGKPLDPLSPLAGELTSGQNRGR